MDASRLFRTLWFTPGLNGRWGAPCIVSGKPGSSKTSRLNQEARAMGLHMETVIASLREPADFLGTPIPQGMVSVSGAAGDVERALVPCVRYAPPAWALELVERGRGVVLFDELNTAPPAVQAALLRVTLEGVIGDLQLPPTIRFVAAKNAVEDAGGYDLSAPLANRFGHLDWEAPSVDAWGDYLTGGLGEQGGVKEMTAEALEAYVMQHWDEPFARAKGTIIGFLRSRRELFLKVPEPSTPEASGAYPTPRSWEAAIRVMAGAEVHGLTVVEKDELITAFVGRGAAKELAVYSKQLDLPDPAALLDGKAKFSSDERLDRTYAVLGSCAALVCPPDAAKRVERAKALWKILGDVCEKGSDLAVPAVRNLIKAGLSTGNKALTETASPVLVHMGPVLREAGYRVGKAS